MTDDNDELMEAGAPIPQIATAKVGAKRTIELTWRSGATVIVDLWPIIANHKAFARLREDDAYFATMQVDPWGWGVFWPDDDNRLAISADWLSENIATDRS